jgi:hypothetical protein
MTNGCHPPKSIPASPKKKELVAKAKKKRQRQAKSKRA